MKTTDNFASCKRDAMRKANREDALRNIRLRKGNYIANRAEIVAIHLNK